MKMDSIPKRDRILDAAEELFAEHGYDGVTLRRIAATADVDVALANYHFGKKLDLFQAVFSRRAELLNEARREALHACQASSGKKGPSVEQIIEAFLRPLELAQETGLGGQVDELLRERLIDVALEHQDAIHELLVQTVKEWPVEKISGQMELELGADLQFIRLNGTLVGGVVGLALHAISLLLA